MIPVAAAVLRTPQIDPPGSNSSDERLAPATVVEMAEALLIAHKNVEKSTTTSGDFVPMNPGGGSCAAAPIIKLPTNERKSTDGCDDFCRQLTEMIVTNLTMSNVGEIGLSLHGLQKMKRPLSI